MTDQQKAIIGLALLPAGLIWHGVVTLQLWRWFAAPLGAPALDLVQAIGVLILVRFVVLARRGEETAETAFWPWLRRQLIHDFGVPALFLAVGQVVALFL
jgi:hypothetical protein